MLSLGPLAFATPWLLSAFIVLPILWWLLRVTPPAPREVRFPAIALLLGLAPREETPARTPLWLILLRMLLAALLILALAHPLLNPTARLQGRGPLVLVVDDGWGAAPFWPKRLNLMADLIDQADREERQVVLVTTARNAGETTAAAEATKGFNMLRPADARPAAAALTPKPWPVDRAAVLSKLAAFDPGGTASVVWLSDGLKDADAFRLAERLQNLGSLKLYADDPADLPRLLAPAATDAVDVAVRVLRPSAAGDAEFFIRASADDGRLLARERVHLGPGLRQQDVKLSMPSELRNRVTRVEIEGDASAGATLLADERWRRRPVGLVSARPLDTGQPLLSDVYYLDRALQPFSEVRQGPLLDLLKRELAMVVLADGGPGTAAERQALADWTEKGGVVLRFAGPRLAEVSDDLLPVTLRRGGRTIGGALSWEQPARLAPFAADSPLAGLAIPGDVTVSRQVLAEPSLDLSAKTWARLSDGTPLVTAEKRGEGWLVLVHTTANTDWTSLPLSGLFVEMLRRIVALSQGVAGDGGDGVLQPLETLDGFGRLQTPPATARPIPAASFGQAVVGPTQPPGFYGVADARRALNLAQTVHDVVPLDEVPAGTERLAYANGREVDLRPALLTATMALALLDLLIAYGLRGLFRPIRAPIRPRGATAALIFLLLLSAAGPGLAQTRAGRVDPTPAGDDGFAQQATIETRLAYVRTGQPGVDEVSRAGLIGLSNALNRRTSVETAEPMEVDVETDELVFFPMLYWPVAPEQPTPSERAVARLNQFLATGGTIVFDTRDQGQRVLGNGTPAADRLRSLVTGLKVPPLVPIPPEHVLTKAFYLMQEFPGRFIGGTLWVEPGEDRINDGVSSVIIGSNDWAGAWAVDPQGRPALPVVPGGEQQREQSLRFGINLVMYILTGNYKADQVHVPAILERLGQ